MDFNRGGGLALDTGGIALRRDVEGRLDERDPPFQGEGSRGLDPRIATPPLSRVYNKIILLTQ